MFHRNNPTEFKDENLRILEKTDKVDELLPYFVEMFQKNELKGFILDKFNKLDMSNNEIQGKQKSLYCQVQNVFTILGNDILSIVLRFIQDEIGNLLCISKTLFVYFNKLNFLYKEYTLFLSNISKIVNINTLVYRINHKRKSINICNSKNGKRNFRLFKDIMFNLQNIRNINILETDNQKFNISDYLSFDGIRFMDLSLYDNNLLLNMGIFSKLYGISISLSDYRYNSAFARNLSLLIGDFDSIYYVKIRTYNPRLLEDIHNSISIKCKNLLYIDYNLVKSDYFCLKNLRKSIFKNRHTLVFPSEISICNLKCSKTMDKFFTYDMSKINKLSILRIENVSYDCIIHRRKQKIGTGMFLS